MFDDTAQSHIMVACVMHLARNLAKDISRLISVADMGLPPSHNYQLLEVRKATAESVNVIEPLTMRNCRLCSQVSKDSHLGLDCVSNCVSCCENPGVSKRSIEVKG